MKHTDLTLSALPNNLAFTPPALSFPFRSQLSFVPLIDALEAKVEEEAPNKTLLERVALEQIAKHPFLHTPIKDSADLAEYSEVVAMLMQLILPYESWSQEIVAAVPPFSMKPFFRNGLFDEVADVKQANLGASNICADKAASVKRMNAYIQILRKVYDWEIAFKTPTVIQFKDKNTQLERYYWAKFTSDFIQVIPLTEPPKLSREELIYIEEHIYQEDVLAQYIDLSQYEFRGFGIFHLSEATFPETLSRLKYELLNKEALTNRQAFESLQQRLRELFALPDLVLGIAAFDIKRDRFHTQYHQITNGLLRTAEENGINCSEFSGCVYHPVIQTGKPLIIADIAKYTQPTRIEEALLAQGVRSLLVAPLVYEGELIGLLEIGSEQSHSFKSDALTHIEQLMPLFSLTLKRSYEDMEAEIEAIMKNQFTAIHPVVEWRFEEEALKIKEQHDTSQSINKASPIAFPQVFPLYGMSDIRNSSTERSNAIRADLETQLILIDDLLAQLMAQQNNLRVAQLRHTLNHYRENLEAGLNSGDEFGILEFIDREIHPILAHFHEIGLLANDAYLQYQNRLDPQLGIIYEKRREFEESLAHINDTIAEYIEEAQKEAQAIFPHYFEKYKTDGVEYNIYIGESLTKEAKFHPVYLDNLRLWQLETMVQVARLAEQIRPQLPLALATTHLILIQSNPIAIRFRLDEKKFDVDGAYNIRYEIVKKRIDKAYIKGTDERLTQPGTIALVYSQDKEAQEYAQYIDFLQHRGLITKEVEYLELEALQGANGLKAMRLILQV